jgi:PPPDE putative peptidase domain
MEEVKDVILNVYTLSVPPTTETTTTTPSTSSTGTTSRGTTTTNNSTSTTNNNNGNNSHSSWTSFLVGKMLPSIGMGAYHTSLRIGTNHDSGPYTTTYTFVANHGIVQEKRQRSSSNNMVNALPSHATFKEEITLGSCTCPRGQVNEIIQILSQYYFTNTSYHLVHRNCNHFTETFAMALIHYPEFIDQMNQMQNDLRPKPPRRRSSTLLSTYPDWINRLANTGANVISHDTDIIPCQPYNEAYHAVTKITLDSCKSSDGGRWGAFASVVPGSKTNATATSSSSAITSKSKKNDKKELTEAQKKLLEKIRKK